MGFLANKDPAARKYAEWTGRAATKDGIDYVLREVDACDLEKARPRATVSGRAGVVGDAPRRRRDGGASSGRAAAAP